MASAMAIGALLGSLFGGVIFEQIGRKNNSIFVIGLTFLLGNLTIALASSAIIIVLGRILLGFGNGVQISTVSVYLLETTTTHFRSRLIGFIMVWQVLGILFTFALSIWFEWMYLALATTICSMLFMKLICILSVESPVWLLKRNKRSEAVKAVQWLSRNNDEETANLLLENIVKPLAFKSEEESKLNWIDFKTHWKRILIAFTFDCSFMTTGNYTMLAYLNIILALLNVDESYVNIITFIISIGLLIAALLSIKISKKFNRKPQIVYSIWAMTICLAILSLLYVQIYKGKKDWQQIHTANLFASLHMYNNLVLHYIFIYCRSFLTEPSLLLKSSYLLQWLSPMIIFLYFFVGDLGVISLVWPVTTEILPPSMRPHLNSIATAITNIIAFITLKTFVGLISAFDLDGTLVFYTILGALTAIFVHIFVPETKHSI